MLFLDSHELHASCYVVDDPPPRLRKLSAESLSDLEDIEEVDEDALTTLTDFSDLASIFEEGKHRGNL